MKLRKKLVSVHLKNPRTFQFWTNQTCQEKKEDTQEHNLLFQGKNSSRICFFPKRVLRSFLCLNVSFKEFFFTTSLSRKSFWWRCSVIVLCLIGKSSEIAPLLTLDFQENIFISFKERKSSFSETVLDTTPYHFGEFVNLVSIKLYSFVDNYISFLLLKMHWYCKEQITVVMDD